jgi:hypothetical protein
LVSGLEVWCSAAFSGRKVVCWFLGSVALQWLHGLGQFWVVSRRRVLETVFVLLESSSPWRSIFIGSHSLPPLWFAVLVLQVVSESVRVFIDSNQSKIQGWRTRNGVRVRHTSMARTTRWGVSGLLRFSVERVRFFGMSRWTQAMFSQ